MQLFKRMMDWEAEISKKYLTRAKKKKISCLLGRFTGELIRSGLVLGQFLEHADSKQPQAQITFQIQSHAEKTRMLYQPSCSPEIVSILATQKTKQGLDRIIEVTQWKAAIRILCNKLALHSPIVKIISASLIASTKVMTYCSTKKLRQRTRLTIKPMNIAIKRGKEEMRRDMGVKIHEI